MENCVYEFVDTLLITPDLFKMLMEKSRVEKPCISKQLLGKNKVTNRKNYHKKSLLASC